jgi:hypothetical protein
MRFGRMTDRTMTDRLLATFLVLLLSLSAPSGSTAQPDLQRLLRERDTPVVPRLPRLPFGARPPLDAPFPVPVPRPSSFLSPQDVLAILAARHLTVVGELRRRGDYYVLDARGPRGEMVRLVINGYSGVVEGVHVLSPRPGVPKPGVPKPGVLKPDPGKPGRGDPRDGNAWDERPREPPR